MGAIFLAACMDSPADVLQPEGTVEALISDAGSNLNGQFLAEGRVQVLVAQDWDDVGQLWGMDLVHELGAGETTIGSDTDAAAVYSGVRLLLRDARVELAAGSEVNGHVLEDDVTITIGGQGNIPAERLGAFGLQQDRVNPVTLHLNSHEWITQNAVETGHVSEAFFLEGIRVTIPVDDQ